MMPPEDFRAAMSHHRGVGLPSTEFEVQGSELEDSSLYVEVSCDEPDSSVAEATGPTSGDENMGVGLAVPTIMLSNSMAAVPLSLESYQSLAPLAVRRGHKVPAPLHLDKQINSREEDLYPGIPSPFLGSPSACDTDSDAGCSPVTSTMDLQAMCRDLRSRCPPLRAVSPLPHDPSARKAAPISAAAALNEDSDDWDFAHDMLLQYGGQFTGFSDACLATPLKAIPNVEEIMAVTPETDSYSWSSTPTLTNSPESPDSTNDDDTTTPIMPDMPKQTRRRTVIIETPRNSIIGNTQPTRVTIDLSHLADSEDVPLSPQFDLPIPFETPHHHGRTSSAISECPYSRPVSSASMKPPVRGILKTREKKSVRFSMMPSMHEYPEDETEPESSFDVDNEPTGPRPGPRTPGRKRASTEPSYRPQADQGRRVAPQGLQAGKDRASFPKHPAVRSFVRGSTPSPTPPSRVPAERQSLQHVLVPRNVDKAEVSGPRRLLKRATLDSPTSPAKNSKRLTTFNDENSRKRSTIATPKTGNQKSRMSAPFKSILTKFRV